MSISTDFDKATAIEKYAIILQERIDSLTDKVHQLEKELAMCKESLLPPPINCRISGGNYSQIYRMYYYPQTVIPTNPMPTPNGFTKYTVVEQGEVQFFNNSTQICVVDDGNFPPGTMMNGKKITGNGIPDGTVIGGYSFGPSKFGGKVAKTIYISLSNTVDVLKADGFFFIENPPPPSQISNVSFSNITTNSFTVKWSGGDGASSYSFSLNSNSTSPNSINDAIGNKTATFSNLQSSKQ